MTLLLVFIFIDASFPQWDCIVITNLFTHLYLTDYLARTRASRTVLPDQAPGVAADAVELLVAGFLLLYGVEEGQGDTFKGDLDL